MKLRVLDRNGLRHPTLEARNDGRLCIRHHGYRLAVEKTLGTPGQVMDGEYDVVARIPKSNPDGVFFLLIRDFKNSRGTILLCFEEDLPSTATVLDRHENSSQNTVVLAIVPE